MMSSDQLTQKKLDEIKPLFAALDLNRDGCVSANELKNIFRSNGLKLENMDEKIEKWIKKVDVNNDGKLNLEELAKAITSD